MMRAGTARTDITPAAGTPMAAFPAGPRRAPRVAEGIRDPLEARAVVLDDGATRIALCACDLTLIDTWDVNDIRAMVENAVPALPTGQIMIAATHTHAAAETTCRFGGRHDDPMVEVIKQRIARTVIDASARLENVALFTASTHAALNHNRRVMGPDGRSRMIMEYDPATTVGPVDDELSVLRLDSAAGGTMAILFDYSAHALTLGPANRLLSADYPGVARRHIEAAFPGSMALFVNGAAGNLHPRQCMRTDDSALRWMGAALGDATIAAARQARTIDACRIAHRRRMLTFPNRMDPSLAVDVELAVVELGTVCIGFLPGEIFVEFQLAFKQALAPRSAFLVGYANGWPGYVPTRAAYDEGGYGVDPYPQDPVTLSRTCLPAGAGEEMLAALITLAK